MFDINEKAIIDASVFGGQALCEIIAYDENDKSYLVKSLYSSSKMWLAHDLLIKIEADKYQQILKTMHKISHIKSQINLLRGQLKSIKESHLFTGKEMERLTPTLVEHIRIKENELAAAKKNITVKGTVTLPGKSSSK